MNLPESWTERFPLLESLEQDWEPLARWALVAWLVFYAIFLLELASRTGPLPMIDLVFVPIHEAGHLLFSYFGRTLMILGGTFLQLFVPLALGVYFAFRRQISAPYSACSAFSSNSSPSRRTWPTRAPGNCRCSQSADSSNTIGSPSSAWPASSSMTRRSPPSSARSAGWGCSRQLRGWRGADFELKRAIRRSWMPRARSVRAGGVAQPLLAGRF
jgi:hypothetical protein